MTCPPNDHATRPDVAEALERIEATLADLRQALMPPSTPRWAVDPDDSRRIIHASDATAAPEPPAAPDADHESPPCDSGREQPLTEDRWRNLRIENPLWRCTDPEWPVFRWLVGIDPKETP